MRWGRELGGGGLVKFEMPFRRSSGGFKEMAVRSLDFRQEGQARDFSLKMKAWALGLQVFTREKRTSLTSSSWPTRACILSRACSSQSSHFSAGARRGLERKPGWRMMLLRQDRQIRRRLCWCPVACSQATAGLAPLHFRHSRGKRLVYLGPGARRKLPPSLKPPLSHRCTQDCCRKHWVFFHWRKA